MLSSFPKLPPIETADRPRAERRQGVPNHTVAVTRFCARTLAVLSLAVLARELNAVEPVQLRVSVYTVPNGADVQFRLQARLIEAIPGDVIQLNEGRYELRRQLDVVADNITILGKGSDKTILSFKTQDTGGQGIEATGNNFTVAGLAVEDTAGNAIKVLGARGVTFRDVRAEWTGEALASNGAYGLYPVQCQNVLIENCTARGASDAGIYVGQSRNVIVRSSRAERNVAGIEIENTVNADVYDNVATNNAGGLLVFDLPGLQVKAGRNVRLFKNRVIANNHRNFAAPGNVVATVPPGTGVMIMATDHVEVFDNDVRENQTANLSIVSYHIAGKRVKDPQYDAYPEGISIHDNRIKEGGQKPSGAIGKLLAPVFGGRFPDILFDGMIDADKLVDGVLPNHLSHRITDNGDATFANFNLALLSPQNVVTGKYHVNRDLAPFRAKLEPLPPVELAPPGPPSPANIETVRVYRSAPKKLSDYGLFQGNGATQEPLPGVLPYDLNTPLFSDYTSKYRFIRIPADTQIEYREEGVFSFPVGTVIAKTFSYPVDMRDASLGERLLETRIETLRAEGWYGFSYLWNQEQTEATLALGGSEIAVSWTHLDGTLRTNKYQVPNANQCLNCHSDEKAFVPLGPTARNLNRAYDYAHGGENQLTYMSRVGALHDLPALDHVGLLPRYDDSETGSVAERARAWLDVNCAHCHSPHGSARTSGLDLRLAQQDAGKFGVWKTPVAAGHGSGGRDYDIVPGKPDESIMMFRLESEDPSVMMPNVSRRLVPVEAVALLREWILGMEAEQATDSGASE